MKTLSVAVSVAKEKYIYKMPRFPFEVARVIGLIEIVTGIGIRLCLQHRFVMK